VVASICTRIAIRLPRRAGDRLMELCAPLALFVMASWWLLVIVLGGLVLIGGLHGAVVGQLGEFVVFHPQTYVDVLTLGVAVWWSLLLLAGSFATHLLRFTDAYSRRERLVTGLGAMATEVTDADLLLANHLRSGTRDNLDAQFKQWLDWIADVHSTHTGYPALVYYRSTTRLSWLQAAVIMLDTAALVRAVAPGWAPPHAEALLEGGGSCLRELAAGLGIVLPIGMDTVSLQGREERAFGDTMRLAVCAGLPEERDGEGAWRVFQQERTRYAPYAVLMGSRLLCDRMDFDEMQSTKQKSTARRESSGMT
jgi:hypothetical protein